MGDRDASLACRRDRGRRVPGRGQRRGRGARLRRRPGRHVPAQLLGRRRLVRPGSPAKLGVVLLLLGVLVAGLSFVRGWSGISTAGGSVALAVTLGFALQLCLSVQTAGGSVRDAVGAIGFAVYVTIAGALALRLSL